MVVTAGIDLDAVAGALINAGQGLGEAAIVTVALPGDVMETLSRRPRAEMLEAATVAWRAPDGLELLGLGSALTVTGPVDCSFGAALPQMRRWLATTRGDGVAEQARLRLFAGARFAPSAAGGTGAWEGFGGWSFGAPVFLLARDGDRVDGSVSLVLGPSSRRDEVVRSLRAALEAAPAPHRPEPGGECGDAAPERWNAMVEQALREIRAGDYRKVVLARSRTLALPGRLEAGRVLEQLGARYPRCFLFKRTARGSVFAGATPELLCRIRNGHFEAASLAGSRPRGETPEADEALRQGLLNDEKERREHAVVTESILDRINGIAHAVRAPSGPGVAQHANIQHLFTPIEAVPAVGRDILDFVIALHPTPAVGGYPAAEAIDAIARLEGLDRGWYAGPVGWVDTCGDGEFAVALRSALLSGDRATLYAGAGIVEGSDASREWAETGLKMRPLLEAIGG